MKNDVDVIGLKSLMVYDTDGKYRGTLKHITSKALLGVGKTINKRILDAVDWKPWTYHAPRIMEWTQYAQGISPLMLKA